MLKSYGSILKDRSEHADMGTTQVHIYIPQAWEAPQRGNRHAICWNMERTSRNISLVVLTQSLSGVS
jgi:hypothetical protein